MKAFKPLILASGSPRRIEMLKALKLDFSVVPAAIEEKLHPGETPLKTSQRLALEKALKVALSAPVPAYVLGADTLVTLKGRIYGKPRNSTEAARFLKEL